MSEATNDMEDYSYSTRELRWLTFPGMVKCVDDLSFTSRVENGSINWWDISPAKTNYWTVHKEYGRAMALELLDLIHNPEREEDEDGQAFNAFGQIAGAIVRFENECRRKYNTDGMSIGFFEAIGEHLTNGNYNR